MKESAISKISFSELRRVKRAKKKFYLKHKNVRNRCIILTKFPNTTYLEGYARHRIDYYHARM